MTAERVVLSLLLKKPHSTYEEVARMLGAEDFYDELHRAIFVAIGEAIAMGDPVEAAMIGERVATKMRPDAYPGVQYLRKLVGMPDGESGSSRYAAIVLEHSVRRTLHQRLERKARNLASAQGSDVESLIRELDEDVAEMRSRFSQEQAQEFASIGDFTEQALNQIQKALDEGDPDGITGTRTGFNELDKELMGLQQGDLIILAARPSMGKTTLAMNIAEHVAERENRPVAVFSIEMGGTQLAMRSLSASTGIDSRRLRSGQLHEHEWADLVEAMERAKKSQQWVDAASLVTPNTIRRRLREMRKKGVEVGLVVVDYLQLMVTASSSAREARAQQVGEISRGLKSIAKEFKVPVLALSQLNRAVDMRPDKRPVMSDLRESGAIEQDADVILFIYRDDFYNADSPSPGLAEVIIGKHRSGPVGMVTMRFDKDRSKFSEVAVP
jgi:replicative DNA helicase